MHPCRLLFFLIIALIGGMAAQRLVELKRLSRLATVVTIGAVSSLSIPMLSLVTPQTMTEESMAIQMAAVLLLSLAAAHLIRATVRNRFANSESAMLARLLSDLCYWKLAQLFRTLLYEERCRLRCQILPFHLDHSAGAYQRDGRRM